jgi:hypothetical protein
MKNNREDFELVKSHRGEFA